jgi:hypothetical protein
MVACSSPGSISLAFQVTTDHLSPDRELVVAVRQMTVELRPE